MRWLDQVSRDPVPWLLDPENPSSRFLTLRDIFNKHPDKLREEQERILDWSPVKLLRSHWDPVNLWGRSQAPYFGGPVGNFGSLHMLQQIGASRFPEVQIACESLLSAGMIEEGIFSPEKNAAAPWLCYTGIALSIMYQFGFGEDSRTLGARDTMVDTILRKPEKLSCAMVRGECRDGLVKALNALLHLPDSQRNHTEELAIDTLCDKLISYKYDFSGEDAEWILPRFPRYYESDIVELCHVLAHTIYRYDPRLLALLQPLLALQNTDGKWSKARSTPSLSVERIQQPSRWLTYEAIHTLTLVYGDDIYGAR
jgi:hypothetical protein